MVPNQSSNDMKRTRPRICDLCGRTRGTRRGTPCTTICGPITADPYLDLGPDIGAVIAAVTADEAPLLDILQRLTEPQNRHEMDDAVDLDNLDAEGGDR